MALIADSETFLETRIVSLMCLAGPGPLFGVLGVCVSGLTFSSACFMPKGTTEAFAGFSPYHV